LEEKPLNPKQKRKNRAFKFNKKSIENLPSQYQDSPSADQEYSDIECKGLKISVSKNGRRFFLHRYRIMKGDKKIRRSYRIGEFPAFSILEARQIVNENKRKIALGIDPLEEVNKQSKQLTFKEFFETEYMPNYARKVKKSWKHDQWMYGSDLKKTFGNHLLSDISKHEITKFFYSVKDRTSGARANRFLSLISKVLSTAIDWEFLDGDNPCRRIKKFKESAGRTRYLSHDEIKRLKTALDASSQKVSALAIWFLLTTGCRLGEAMSLTWDNIDMDKKVARLPKEMTKNGNSRLVVLNEQALETLQTLKNYRVKNSPYVFPGTGPTGHLVTPRRAFDTVKTNAKLENLHLHDLRHSFASLAISDANTSLFTVSKLLGHQSQAMTMRYSHLAQKTLIDATESVSSQLEEATK
jgi:integrase